MKYLIWFRQNLNLISFVAGVGFVLAGRDDVAQLLFTNGGQL